MVGPTSKTSEWIEAPNLTALLNASHAGKWVAFSHDYSSVLASADSVSVLMETLTEEERKADPIFYKVPSQDSYYIPAIQ